MQCPTSRPLVDEFLMSDTLNSTADLEEGREESINLGEKEKTEEKKSHSKITIKKESILGQKKEGNIKEEKEESQGLSEFDDDLEDNDESVPLLSKSSFKKTDMNESLNEFTDEETKEEKKSIDERASFFSSSPMSKSEAESSFSRKRLSIIQAREVAGDIAVKLDSDKERRELEKE